MKIGFKIARRFLKSNLGQTFLIILGIGIGVSVQVFIGSLIQGLQKSLIETTIGTSPQITISEDGGDGEIEDYEGVLSELKSVDGVTKISAAADHPAFLGYKDKSQSLLVRGMDFDRANEIYEFSENLEGDFPKGEDEIMVGVDLKGEYGLVIGDEVDITTPEGNTVVCTIVGFFDLKVSSINKTWAITTLDNAQTIFGTEGQITSIEMQVSAAKLFLADEIGTKIKKSFENDKFIVNNWKDQNQQLLSGLQGQSVSSTMIQVFVLISVVLGIASVLAITVMQKSKQIGILKAMGIKNSSAAFVFLFEGLILGFFGAVVGVLLGLGLSYSFTKFALNPDGTPVVALYIDRTFILVSGLIAMGASVIASGIPALRSMKLNPIDIIRNN